MYNFDGTFKQKPHQAYGNCDARRKMNRNEIAQEAARERTMREWKRKQESSATLIQSCYRSYIDRRRKQQQLRAEFDTEIKLLSSEAVGRIVSLSRKLAFFCQHDSASNGDESRLVSLCQKILSHKDVVMMTMMATFGNQQQNIMTICIKRLLSFCCRFIRHQSLMENLSLAIPLRMLETFTTPEVYLSAKGESSEVEREEFGVQAPLVVNNVKHYLVNNGYFTTIGVLLDSKVPPSLLHTDNFSNVPMATAVYDLVRRFFQATEENRDIIYYKAADELFSRQLSNQMRNFLLPRLSDPSSGFPYFSMSESLSRQQCLTTLSTQKSLNLLYCILSLGKPYFDKFDASQFSSFLEVISNLIGYLKGKDQPTFKGYALNQEDHDDDEEEEEEGDDEENGIERMDWTSNNETPNEKEEKKIKQSCLSLLGGDNIDLSRRLTKLLSTYEVGCIAENDKAILSLCKICYAMIGPNRHIALQKHRILSVLGCSPVFIEKVWELLYKKIVAGSSKPVQVIFLSQVLNLPDEELNLLIATLSTFSNLYSYHLQTLSDTDFSGQEGFSRMKPFADRETVSKVTIVLRDCCLNLIELIHPDPRSHNYAPLNTKTHSRKDEFLRVFWEVVTLVKQLYERDCRIKFCPRDSWAAPGWSVSLLSTNAHNFIGQDISKLVLWNLSGRYAYEVRSCLSANDIRILVLLRELPFIIRFEERIIMFRQLLDRDKPPFVLASTASTITIRRKHLYEDAYRDLQENKVPDMKVKLHFSLISTLGTEEVGIDGGGIFRETIREIIKAGFNPELGFFQATPQGLLFPNHLVKYLHTDYINHYYFLGRVLGKAIYANLVVDLPLASFFLVKLLSRGSSSLDIHHFSSLDPELHRNILYLKNYEGDISDLSIDFVVSYDVVGNVTSEELKPNGRNIMVDNSNKFEYIHLVADWYLNRRIREHCNAFRSGLANVIGIEWLRLFDHNEFQYLISGANAPIDLEDLKKHTNYSGGYTAEHEVVAKFWEVIQGFTETEKRDLLKFVTSCPRAPLHGFKELRPSFCIHYAGSELDRLPTASTCMNQLKLPAFKDKDTLRSKLLYAIKSEAGFELS